MKHVKRIGALLLAVVMVFALTATAFANDNAHTITIENEKTGHTYTAYQIFAGDIESLEGKTVLTNIVWGSGVDGAALLNELKTVEDYAACESAEDVARVLMTFADDSEKLDAFAEIAGKHLATAAGTSTEDTGKYTIPVTGDGYYLVKDTGSVGDGDAKTKYILKVVENVAVKAKADAPTLKKEIVENDAKTTSNSAAIGDTVNYEITSKVPEMDGYDKYFFVVNDTMSEGLDFNDDVAIKIGETTLTADAFTVSTSGKTTIKIVIKNFIQYKENAGDEITITYSAKVNENAVIGTLPNTNEAQLVYSNDPNTTSQGTDEPTEGDVTGKTPTSTTYTYVTDLTIVKTNREGKHLAGAEFDITGTALNTILVKKDVFTEDAAGTWYKLKDGTYTETAPDAENSDKYESTETKYTKSETTETIEKPENVTYHVVVGADGILHLEGLNAGTYTITETKAPEGYNLLKEPVEVTISWNAPENGSTECTWTYSEDAPNGVVTIVNSAGTQLPSTGGIGTTVFYVVGAILVLAAIVLLVTKKRMSAKN